MTASLVHSSVLPDCRPLLADPDDLTLVFQPIVDLAAVRVVGYAAHSRFPGTASPEVWYAAAHDAGVGAELEALAVHKALAARAGLPPDTSLTVAVSAHLLGSAPVRAALRSVGDLRAVVVQLTGHAVVDDADALCREVDALRARGALIALDAAGTRSAGPGTLTRVRPELVVLGRALVGDGDGDGDPARPEPAETVGDCARRIGARLVAEGIETPAQLAAAHRLGTRLAQGWLLGRPAPGPRPLAPETERLLRAHAARARRSQTVAGLVRPVRQVAVGTAVPGIPPVVLVGDDEQPLGLRLADRRMGAVRTAPASLRVTPDADVRQTLRRALIRPPAQRYDPVVCTDATGAVVGLLRLDDLAAAASAAR